MMKVWPLAAHSSYTTSSQSQVQAITRHRGSLRGFIQINGVQCGSGCGTWGARHDVT
ncbi:hypothetical protein [Nonomuraea sp. NPDC049158]|uniref:hypothetical protein n=1 Tax=Nonomuraea sp. NPDC049158 TaxID=3155649 RepID=UPI0033D51AEC